MKRVKFNLYEMITQQDLNNVGIFSRDQLFELVKKVVASSTRDILFVSSPVIWASGSDTVLHIEAFIGIRQSDGAVVVQQAAATINFFGFADLMYYTIEAAPAEVDGDPQTRYFIAPDGTTYTQSVNKESVYGAAIAYPYQPGSAPAKSSGAIKLGEVYWDGVTIQASHVKPVTSQYGEANTGWTNETQVTNLSKSLSDHRTAATIDHPDKSIPIEKLTDACIEELTYGIKGAVDYWSNLPAPSSVGDKDVYIVRLSSPGHVAGFYQSDGVSTWTLLAELASATQLYDLVVKTQAEFEAFFSDGTAGWTAPAGWGASWNGTYWTITPPKNTSIFLKADPDDGTTANFKNDGTSKAYILKSKVILPSSSFIIRGEGVDDSILTMPSSWSKFTSDYVVQKTGCSNSAGGNAITVPNTTGLIIGQTVYYTQATDNGRNFYRILNIAGLVVTVDGYINSATGGGILSLCVTDIEIENITLDGVNAVKTNGGILELKYCAHSKFNLLRNGRADQYGGGAWLQGCYRNEIYTNGCNVTRTITGSLNCYGGGVYANGCQDNVLNARRCYISVTVPSGAGPDGYSFGAGVHAQSSLNNTIEAYECYISAYATDSTGTTVRGAGNGGGVSLNASSHNNIKIRSCRIRAEGDKTGGGALDLAARGGGLYAMNGSAYNSVDIADCWSYVRNNSSNGGTDTIHGGGAYVDGSVENVLNIAKCRCTYTCQGTIYLAYMGGGGLFLNNGSDYTKATVRSCYAVWTTLTANPSSGCGGGGVMVLSCERNELNVMDSYIDLKAWANSGGGGIWGSALKSSSLKVCGCYTLGTTILQGGGVRLDTGSDDNCIDIRRSYALNSSVVAGTNAQGGGIYISNSTRSEISIANCYAQGVNAAGGGIYAYTGADGLYVSIFACYTVGSTSSNGGGGMFNGGVNAYLRNVSSCYTSGTAATQYGGGVYLTGVNENGCIMTGCWVGNTALTAGNHIWAPNDINRWAFQGQHNGTRRVDGGWQKNILN